MLRRVSSTLLHEAADLASRYLEHLPDRSVAPHPDAVDHLPALDGDLDAQPMDASAVLRLLHAVGSPATVASAGPRYFGFVIGGSLPAALAANWLAGAWDQNAVFVATSPAVAVLEAIALRWLLELLGLPPDAAGAFVTGATMAN